MHPYQWILIEPERQDKDIEEGVIKPIKGTKDASLHSENEEVRNHIVLLTGALRQEEHASNADKWVTSPETAQGGRSRKKSTLSTMTTTSRSTSQPPPYHETMWPR